LEIGHVRPTEQLGETYATTAVERINEHLDQIDLRITIHMMATEMKWKIVSNPILNYSWLKRSIELEEDKSNEWKANFRVPLNEG